eukprot:9498287-Pyramimonas_sp.AAC.1
MANQGAYWCVPGPQSILFCSAQIPCVWVQALTLRPAGVSGVFVTSVGSRLLRLGPDEEHCAGRSSRQ